MILLICLYLFFVGSYLYNKNFFFIGVIFFLTMGLFFFYRIANPYAPTVYNIMMIAILTLFVLERKTRKYFKLCFVYIFIYFIYLLLISLFQSSDFLYNLNFYRIPFFGLLLGLLLYENIKAGKIKDNLIVNSLYLILALQFSLSLSQYFSPSFSQYFQIQEFKWRGETISMINDFDLNKNLMLGTFMGTTSFAIYLSITIIALLSYEFSRISTLKLWKIVLLVFGFIALILTGIRSPFLICLVAIFILFYRYKRKLFYTSFSLLFLIILYFGFNFLISSSTNGLDYLTENPIDRLMGIFVLFSGNMELLEMSTIGLSILMLPYVFRNPFFGLGLHNSIGYKFPSGMKLEDFSTTDAQLLFTIAEIGVVGILIVLYPFYYFIRLKGFDIHTRKHLKFLFYVAICLSLIDMGIFSVFISFYFFYIAGASLTVNDLNQFSSKNENKTIL